MAPAPTDSPSQADTPMTDVNDDVIPSVPVDAPTVGRPVPYSAFCRDFRIASRLLLELDPTIWSMTNELSQSRAIKIHLTTR